MLSPNYLASINKETFNQLLPSKLINPGTLFTDQKWELKVPDTVRTTTL